MRQALRSMRLNIIAFVVLVILAGAGILLIRYYVVEKFQEYRYGSGAESRIRGAE